VTASAIYQGRLRHRRLSPVEHSFSYRVWMLLVDLDELPELFDRHPLWSARRAAPVRFRRSDYLGDPALPLAEAARDLVEQRCGRRPDGPVRLLTMARTLGAGYNPVSFYYLYERGGLEVQAMIAEVTNTPWGERHHYVIERQELGAPLGGRMVKRLHVSPFMPMDQTYEWSSSDPRERLGVRIATRERGELVFEAALALRRRNLTPATMTTVPLSHPPQVIAAIARIYGNALRLRLKGAPFFPHPQRRKLVAGAPLAPASASRAEQQRRNRLLSSSALGAARSKWRERLTLPPVDRHLGRRTSR
jgi:uncharacterized protein